MDNLELLKQLPNESIDLIYCDILYNTGRKFDDYDDDLGDTLEAIEWYRPRLIEMRRALKSTGSIYLHMDNRLSSYIRILMDDIFGKDRFVNEVIWHYSKMNNTNSKFIPNHDNILLYSKTDKYTFYPQYNEVESALKQRLRRFIKDNKIVYKSVKNHSSQLMDNYIRSARNRLGKEELDDNDVVIDFEGKGRQKVDTVWRIPIIRGNSHERVDYDTQKPKALLERVVKASSKKDDVVADFFMGSGTTIEVAKELGRNYIGCDINPRAIEITQERLDSLKVE